LLKSSFKEEPIKLLPFSILCYVALGIQLGLGSYASFRGVSPNLVLLVVVFISLNARREPAMLGCFLLGAVQDLISLQPVGLFALSYGMVALLVCWLAESVKRSHPLTHLFLTFLSGCLMAMILIVHDYFRPIGSVISVGGTVVHAVRIGPRVMMVSVLYTTLLAPIVIGLLQLANGLFGFESNRRRARV
jgi:rod shape-determining protein MreD